MQIVLIRHGQTPGNALRRYIGRTDIRNAAGCAARFCHAPLPDTADGTHPASVCGADRPSCAAGDGLRRL